jgi:ketosteroid isomerase-like protein
MPASQLPTASEGGSAATPDAAALLARYQQAWSEGDIEAIISMTAADGVYEASFGPHPWGQRFVGLAEIRTALVEMGLDQPARPRHQYGETHVVGDRGFAMWSSVQDRSSGAESIVMHGADFYRFRDGLVAAKIAYRKAIQT